MTTPLYETDFYAWTRRQAALMRAQEFEAVDWHNLIEEIETLGRSDKREVANRLEVLMLHLLKLTYQPRAPRFTRGWHNTIAEQRQRLLRLLRESPSLRAQLSEIITDVYPDAIKSAARETGLDASTFPAGCPYTAEQILDEAFWPPT